MTSTDRKQQAIFLGYAVIFRTVRRVQTWDGRTVGVVRNGRGAEFVVQHVPLKDRWDTLDGVSAAELEK